MKNVSIALAYTGAPGSAASSSEGANFPARQDFIALHGKSYFSMWAPYSGFLTTSTNAKCGLKRHRLLIWSPLPLLLKPGYAAGPNPFRHKTLLNKTITMPALCNSSTKLISPLPIWPKYVIQA